jgi:hypothetical protein
VTAADGGEMATHRDRANGENSRGSIEVELRELRLAGQRAQITSLPD